MSSTTPSKILTKQLGWRRTDGKHTRTGHKYSWPDTIGPRRLRILRVRSKSIRRLQGLTKGEQRSIFDMVNTRKPSRMPKKQCHWIKTSLVHASPGLTVTSG